MSSSLTRYVHRIERSVPLIPAHSSCFCAGTDRKLFFVSNVKIASKLLFAYIVIVVVSKIEHHSISITINNTYLLHEVVQRCHDEGDQR